MAWTPEQCDAINARGSSVIVSAAAGSGKTSVLVQRLIGIISDQENRVPADRIAVVTFTRDAAAEMKQRLTSALADLIENEHDNQWLNQQQLMLQSSKISTIHSFCFDLIRDNIQELDITPGFRIMDEIQADITIASAVSDTVDEYYSRHNEEISYLYDKFCYKDDTALENLITDIYKYMLSVPYGQKWLEKSTLRYADGSLYNEYCTRCMSKIQNLLTQACNLSAECTGLISEADLPKCQDILDTEFFSISKLLDIMQSDELSAQQKISMYVPPSFARLVLGNKIDADVKESIQSARDSYKKIINENITYYIQLLSHSEEDFDTHFRVLTILQGIMCDVDKKIWKIKTEKNCIDFSDAERLAVKLLSQADENGNITKSELAKQLSDYYKVIMIDEFQDTNNNQDLIFRLLSHNSDAVKTGDNLFAVGDVKQSIYGFRLANPRNFINSVKSAVPYSKAGNGENAYIKLNRNFRSSSEVIDFVNFVFTGLMGPKVGEIEYNDEEKLVRGAEFVPGIRDTQIALLTEDDSGCQVTGAQYTASVIADMLRQKTKVTNKDGHSERDCTKRDFCILLRSKKHAAEYVKALGEYGISAYSEEETGYLRSREISVLISLMRIVDNPLLDTSFTAVLLSPMFAFTDDEMVMLRILNCGVHIYELINDARDNEEYDITDQLRDKCRNVCDVITQLRLHAATLSLTDFIRRIYDRTDFMSVIQICKDSEKKKANLRVLLEYAKMYEESTEDGLSGFLRYIDRISDINGDFRQGQTVSTSEDAVMIKTIHKSKGLEFPFVFLCETQSLFNKGDMRKNIAMSFENGIGFRLQDRREFKKFATLPFEVISSMNNCDSISEELRLLYVALTRARERLFIPMTVGAAEKKKLMRYARDIHEHEKITQELASSAASMSDWLFMSLLTHHNSAVLRKMSGYDMFYTDSSDFKIDFRVIDYSEEAELSASEENLNDESILEDKELADKLTQRFTFVYPGLVSELQSKISVSDIAKSKNDMEIVMKKPEFSNGEAKLTASEQGTVIHSVLQHADFNKLQDDTVAEVNRLVNLGFISQLQAENIDLTLIDRFINSSLFSRVRDSGRVEREKKFLMRITDLDTDDEMLEQYKGTDAMIQGIIDMYFEDGGKLVLVDYKTDNVSDIRQLAYRYSTQLKIYKSALVLMEEKEVKDTVIYSLRLGQEYSIRT